MKTSFGSIVPSSSSLVSLGRERSEHSSRLLSNLAKTPVDPPSPVRCQDGSGGKTPVSAMQNQLDSLDAECLCTPSRSDGSVIVHGGTSRFTVLVTIPAASKIQ